MSRGWGRGGDRLRLPKLVLALLGSVLGFAPGVNAEPRAYETRDEEPPPASQEQPPPTTTGQSGVAPSTAAPSKQKRPSKREDYPPAIEPRRGGSNYFMVGLYDSTDKDAHLVKFQVDLEYDVM